MSKFLVMAGLLLASCQAIPETQAVADVHAFETGQELLALCDERSAHLSKCMGYIEAAHDMLDTLAALKDMPPRVCVSLGARPSSGQLRLVALKYLKANPNHLHWSASYSVLLALIQAYPCH